NQVGCNDDQGSSCSVSTLRSRLSISVNRNTTYIIRVGGYNGATGSGVLTVSQSVCPAPGNDICANAPTVSWSDIPIALNNSGATTDGPIEQNVCNAAGSAQIFSDVWYRYIAPCTGTVRVSTCGGTSLDSKIAIYNSCPGSFNTAIA